MKNYTASWPVALALIMTLHTSAAMSKGRTPSFDIDQQIDLSTRWEPVDKKPKIIILALHGMAMHGSTFQAFGRRMVNRGIMVVAPDLPGYGNKCQYTSSKCSFHGRMSLEFATHSIETLRRNYPGVPLVLLGESLGGALAIQLATNKPEDLDGLILTAPALAFSSNLALRLIPKLFLSALDPHAMVQLRSLIAKYSSDQDTDASDVCKIHLREKTTSFGELFRISRFLAHAKSDVKRLPPHLPLLVLQGSEDRIINPSVPGSFKNMS